MPGDCTLKDMYMVDSARDFARRRETVQRPEACCETSRRRKCCYRMLTFAVAMGRRKSGLGQELGNRSHRMIVDLYALQPARHQVGSYKFIIHSSP